MAMLSVSQCLSEHWDSPCFLSLVSLSFICTIHPIQWLSTLLLLHYLGFLPFTILVFFLSFSFSSRISISFFLSSSFFFCYFLPNISCKFVDNPLLVSKFVDNSLLVSKFVYCSFLTAYFYLHW